MKGILYIEFNVDNKGVFVAEVLTHEGDGHGFEREVMGHTVYDVDPKLRCDWVHNLREGFERVRERQHHLNWNPRRPKTDLGWSLFHAVSSKLRRKGDLLMFDAVGTVLDFRWGVDCWFECGNRIATVDLTVSRTKHHFKAHFLVRRVDFLWNRHYGVGRAIARKLSQ